MHRNHPHDFLKSQFSKVAIEFNSQMADALSVEGLGQVWEVLRSQVGEFESVTDQRVTNTQGVTVVTFECQFERATLNVIVAFDGEDKIGGLRFVTAQTGSTQPSVPSITKWS